MSILAQSETDSEDSSKLKSRFWKLTLGCVGVVYGDIGTSPLYAFRESAHVGAGADGLQAIEVYGILSLIIWALLIIVTIKYVLFLLRMDNRGEGGILSLMALARKGAKRGGAFIMFLGIIGAALFYGDAAITPAISVFSAVEGLALVNPAFGELVMPISVLILFILFMVQKKGTSKVSAFFGPVTAIWFLALGAAGISWIIKHPDVLLSFNPAYGIDFLLHHGKASLLVLGAVFLSVTGAEALYADLGHFGRKPIRTAWLLLVFPCLVLNYLGQGALVLSNPAAIANPFYLLVPQELLLPMVCLATMATIVASQAVITGAYSLTRQAIQLGLLPRMEIRHTSIDHEGQIYMPKLNNMLLYAVLLLCFVFKSSAALASAYGIAVSGTMIVTTLLSCVVLRKIWKRSFLIVFAVAAPFVVIEGVFFWANLLKLFDGGYVPLFLAAFIVTMMATWVRGTRYLYRQAHRKTVVLSDLMESLEREPPTTVEGTAIFLTSDPHVAPVALVQNLRHNKVLHRNNIVLTVITMPAPKVPKESRVHIEHLSSRMTRVILSFGFMETPDVPRALRKAKNRGLDIDLQEASFFLGRRSIVSSSEHRYQEELAQAWQDGAASGLSRHAPRAAHVRLPEWQDHIFIAMANAAVAATDFFRIPRHQVVEMGTKVAI